MANLSQYLGQGGGKVRSSSLLGPGSNGFWKRAAFTKSGTFQWTAPADGKIKIQALGAAAGAQLQLPGPSAAYGEKVLAVKKGDILDIVVGAGTAGTNAVATSSGQAGTTSISGSAVGGTPLSLIGASGGSSGSGDVGVIAAMQVGRPTGPWDVAFAGTKPLGRDLPSPPSASPLGSTPMVQSSTATGWSGTGAESFVSGVRGYLIPADRGTEAWDLIQAEFYPSAPNIGAIGTGGQIFSLLGGGVGSGGGYPGGFGAGGGSASSGNGGRGGGGLIWLFFDEVTP